MTKDALNLGYDKPVDRIAARLLCKCKDFQLLPEKARIDLMFDTPRIKPQDITFIFDRPPRTRGHQQPIDHRGEKIGCYLVVGYAGSKDQLARGKLELHGGRKCRVGYNHSGIRGSAAWRGMKAGKSKKHFWWVREPDGTISSYQWEDLRRCMPGESVNDAQERRIAAKSNLI